MNVNPIKEGKNLESQGQEAEGSGPRRAPGITLIQLTRMFPDDTAAEKWFEQERWGETGIYCPRCGSLDKIKETPKR